MLYIYNYIYIHTYTYMYVSLSLSLSLCIYIYIYTLIYIYIYIYIHTFSGPWKLSGRVRYVSVMHVSVTFPSRFRYVSINVSVTFPSRFRCVSGRVSAALPLGKRLPDGNYPKTRLTLCLYVCLKCGWASGSEAKPVFAQWFRPRLVTCGLGFDPGGRGFQVCPPICFQ